MKPVSTVINYLAMIPIKAVRRVPLGVWLLAFALGMVVLGAVVSAGVNVIWGC